MLLVYTTMTWLRWPRTTETSEASHLCWNLNIVKVMFTGHHWLITA
jgi:hypothetical protein